MDNRNNPLRHLDLASQHYFMQVLAWMWSMVFSLTFLSIFSFGLTWLAHVLVIAGIAMTVAVFKEAEKQKVAAPVRADDFGHGSKCVWKLDSEA
jgi:predicted membrane protein